MEMMIKAFQEPTRPVSIKFQLSFGLANAGASIALLPVLNILIPAQVAQLDPAHSATNLAIVLATGAAGALISSPLSGALSDRTTSRLGRRTPWILIGMVTTTLGLGILAIQQSIFVLAAGWFMTQFFGNILLSSYNAIIPDRVPVYQRGTTQAIVGLSTPLIMAFSIYYLGKLSHLATGYLTLSILLVLLTIVFLSFFREPQLPTGILPPLSLKAFIKSLWINPRQNPDFGMAWIFWFMIWSAYALSAGGFQYLFLQNAIHYSTLFPGHSPQEGVATIQILYIIAGIPLMTLAGVLSDRMKSRKIFVTIGASLLACGLFLLGIAPAWGWVKLAGAFIGAGFWIYYTIGLAMISQLLPAASDRGKDLGVVNIAATLPQMIMPWIGAWIINTIGIEKRASYLVMFCSGAAIALGAVLFLQRIKKVP